MPKTAHPRSDYRDIYIYHVPCNEMSAPPLARRKHLTPPSFLRDGRHV